MRRSAAAVLLAAAAWTAASGAAEAATRLQVSGQPQPVAPSPAASRILVMPFDNPAGDGRVHWLREAAAVLLAEDLRAAGANAIGREERVRAFERLGVPATASLSDATVIKIGELVGAATVVVGSLGLNGSELTVRARSIQLDTGRMQAEIVEQAPLPDLFRTFDRVLARLFPLMTPSPGHTEKDHAPLPAFEDYIKGLVAETAPGQINFLQAAVKSFPEYDAARLALWQVYALQGDHAKALDIALAVRQGSPAYRRARFLAALSELQLKQYDAAAATLVALNEERPAAAALNNLGVVQVRRAGQLPTGAASYYFGKARDLDPGDSDYTFNLGYSYLLERDVQAAIYWLRVAVRQYPADGEAHYVLGAALTATGAATEGNREKELARRLSSRFAEWDRRPAGDPVPHGLSRLKEDLDVGPGSRDALAYEAAGQKDQQDLATFHLAQGRRLFEQENDRDATVELNRAIYLSPYQAEAHLLLGRIDLRNGRVREAIEDLKISLWSQETVAAHVALAEAYLQAKDPVAARAEAQRALSLDPQSSEARRLLERIGPSAAR